MSQELAQYIAISVDAVGGPESEAGKEMMHLLLTRDGAEVPDQPQQKLAAPTSETPAVEKVSDSILGTDLESMFSRVFVTDKALQ